MVKIYMGCVQLLKMVTFAMCAFLYVYHTLIKNLEITA